MSFDASRNHKGTRPVYDVTWSGRPSQECQTLEEEKKKEVNKERNKKRQMARIKEKGVMQKGIEKKRKKLNEKKTKMER